LPTPDSASRQRKADGDPGAAGRSVADLDITAVRRDDFGDDREAEAAGATVDVDARVIEPHEPLEDAGTVGDRHARAVIIDVQHGRSVPLVQRQPYSLAGMADGIVDEVTQHPAQLRRVTVDPCR